MDPGLGKTSVVLAAFKILRDKGMVKRMLVVAPRRVMKLVWPDEICKWVEFESLSYCVLHGKDKDDTLHADADIYIINPEGLDWFFKKGGMKIVKPDILCVDELSKFKHSSTKRFKSVRKILHLFQRRWGLTGTPMSNGFMDLFGQCFILDGGHALGKYITHYRMRFFHQKPHNEFSYFLNDGAEEVILDAIKPLALRMDGDDYLDLPEIVNLERLVELPLEAKVQYELMQEFFVSQLANAEISATNAAAAGMKCRQIADGAVYDEFGEYHVVHDAKLDALEELLEELNGAPAFLLYAFTHDKDRILQRLGKDTPVIGGGVSDIKADMYISAFNSGVIPVLVAHPQSAAHGLNLQKVANHVIWFGITWDLEHYDQAMRRVRRQGNPNTHVFVHHIIAKGTVDERMVKMVQLKDKTQRSALAYLKQELVPGLPASGTDNSTQAG